MKLDFFNVRAKKTVNTTVDEIKKFTNGKRITYIAYGKDGDQTLTKIINKTDVEKAEKDGMKVSVGVPKKTKSKSKK